MAEQFARERRFSQERAGFARRSELLTGSPPRALLAQRSNGESFVRFSRVARLSLDGGESEALLEWAWVGDEFLRLCLRTYRRQHDFGIVMVPLKKGNR